MPAPLCQVTVAPAKVMPRTVTSFPAMTKMPISRQVLPVSTTPGPVASITRPGRPPDRAIGIDAGIDPDEVAAGRERRRLARQRQRPLRTDLQNPAAAGTCAKHCGDESDCAIARAVHRQICRRKVRGKSSWNGQPDGPRPPRRLVAHVFPTFAVGGAQVRFAAIANHFGPAFRHIVVSLDGNLACRERLRADLDVDLPHGCRAQECHARQRAGASGACCGSGGRTCW